MLKRPQEEVVQIGSLNAMKTAVPGTMVKPVQIAGANGNGNGSNGHAHGNGNGAAKQESVEPEHVAGD